MQWSTEPNGGFTTSSKPVLPVIDDEMYGFQRVNAGDQRRDSQSLLNWTERIMRMRKECPEIGWGDWKVLKCGSPNVLVMRYDWRGNAVLVIHNLDEKPQTIRFQITGRDETKLVNLLSNEHSEGDGRGGHKLAIEGYGYRWYRVGGLDYILNRARA
jgi:maltose alpha-D-glucosyltransferase/alpha-amylase